MGGTKPQSVKENMNGKFNYRWIKFAQSIQIVIHEIPIRFCKSLVLQKHLDQQLATSLGIDQQILYEDLMTLQNDVSRLQGQF